MFVRDVQRSREVRRDEEPDPTGLEGLLARLGLLGESRPELAASGAFGQRDLYPCLAWIQPACFECSPENLDRARRHVDGHDVNATWPRR